MFTHFNHHYLYQKSIAHTVIPAQVEQPFIIFVLTKVLIRNLLKLKRLHNCEETNRFLTRNLKVSDNARTLENRGWDSYPSIKCPNFILREAVIMNHVVKLGKCSQVFRPPSLTWEIFELRKFFILSDPTLLGNF